MHLSFSSCTNLNEHSPHPCHHVPATCVTCVRWCLCPEYACLTGCLTGVWSSAWHLLGASNITHLISQEYPASRMRCAVQWCSRPQQVAPPLPLPCFACIRVTQLVCRLPWVCDAVSVACLAETALALTGLLTCVTDCVLLLCLVCV